MKELRNYLTQKSTRPACGAGKFIQADGHRGRERVVVVRPVDRLQRAEARLAGHSVVLLVRAGRAEPVDVVSRSPGRVGGNLRMATARSRTARNRWRTRRARAGLVPGTSH